MRVSGSGISDRLVVLANWRDLKKNPNKQGKKKRGNEKLIKE